MRNQSIRICEPPRAKHFHGSDIFFAFAIVPMLEEVGILQSRRVWNGLLTRGAAFMRELGQVDCRATLQDKLSFISDSAARGQAALERSATTLVSYQQLGIRCCSEMSCKIA
jgi:hypothetical protein